MPADSTVVETYLRSRAITLSPLPLTLRCHMALRHAPSNGRWPAMVALVTRDQERLGVHRTYLAWNGGNQKKWFQRVEERFSMRLTAILSVFVKQAAWWWTCTGRSSSLEYQTFHQYRSSSATATS